jgi:hypothetical protein
LPLTWNANFATKDEREKHRLQQLEELWFLIGKL